MNLSLVFLGVVLVVVLYYFLNSGGTTVLSNKIDLSTDQVALTKEQIPDPASAKYSYEMWLYVYNFDGQPHYIISRDSKSDPAKKNIGIKLDGAVPKLSLEYTGNTSGTTAVKTVPITDNFPLQTWVHLIVSIDGTFIDIYMNGKLVKSINDPTIEKPSDVNGINYGKLSCYLAKLSKTSTPTDPQTAWDKYSAGNGENPMSKYLSSFGLSMTLKKNNQDYSNIKLF